MGLPSTPTFLQVSKTATADTPFKLFETPTWMRNIDIMILTNGATMGASNGQAFTLGVGDVYSDNGITDASQYWFKNTTAGSNTVVVLQGTSISEQEGREKGIL